MVACCFKCIVSFDIFICQFNYNHKYSDLVGEVIWM